jgi:hypothetical protein
MVGGKMVLGKCNLPFFQFGSEILVFSLWSCNERRKERKKERKKKGKEISLGRDRAPLQICGALKNCVCCSSETRIGIFCSVSLGIFVMMKKTWCNNLQC